MKGERKTGDLPLIGSTEYIEVGTVTGVPAKIDTGADSSSIHVSEVEVSEEGVLSFVLFDKSSPYYTGEVLSRLDYKAAVVRSATGEEQVRYRTHIPITLAGRKIKVLFFLSDRSKNNFPVLIGRRTLKGKFLVDVSKREVPTPAKNPRTKGINRELAQNPFKFHQKYIKKSNRGTEGKEKK